ncbi:MAG TPA: DUF3108 domain-containing protein [Bacteroidota bacterium]|nr:DUF3108 domain-containing protein [Bacteroidota bacterium]
MHQHTIPVNAHTGFNRCCCLLFVTVLAAATFIFPALLCPHANAQNTLPPRSDTGTDVFLQNEDLTFEVSWMGIALGSIRSVVTRKQGDGETAIVTAVAYIKSYSGVPFVKVHEIDETTMDHAGISVLFRAREIADEKWKFTDYAFDQHNHRLIAKESIADTETGSKPVMQKADTLKIGPDCVDGLALLFFARLHAHQGGQTSVPTIVSGNQGITSFNFYRKETSAEIDAVDYPVDVIEFNGEAKFSGVLGMTGPFTGWFSNDTAQIPIKGKLKILLGSITVELIKWNRPGWNPPRSRSAR